MEKKIVYHRPGKEPPLGKDEEAVELSEGDFAKYSIIKEVVSELRKNRRQ